MAHAPTTIEGIPNTPYLRFPKRNTELRQRQPEIDWAAQAHRLYFTIKTSDWAYAITRAIGGPSDWGQQKVVIELNRYFIMRLCGTGVKKLTDVEMLKHTYHLAVCLLHELGHACGILELNSSMSYMGPNLETGEEELIGIYEVCLI